MPTSVTDRPVLNCYRTKQMWKPLCSLLATTNKWKDHKVHNNAYEVLGGCTAGSSITLYGKEGSMLCLSKPMHPQVIIDCAGYVREAYNSVIKLFQCLRQSMAQGKYGNEDRIYCQKRHCYSRTNISLTVLYHFLPLLVVAIQFIKTLKSQLKEIWRYACYTIVCFHTHSML